MRPSVFGSLSCVTSIEAAWAARGGLLGIVGISFVVTVGCGSNAEAPPDAAGATSSGGSAVGPGSGGSLGGGAAGKSAGGTTSAGGAAGKAASGGTTGQGSGGSAGSPNESGGRAGTTSAGNGGSGASSGDGGTTSSGGSAGSGGSSGSNGSSGSSGAAGSMGCDPGQTTTEWADECPTSTPACTPGTWTAWGSSSPENYPLQYETAHFAFYWPESRGVSMTQAQTAGEYLENVVWKTYLGSPIYWQEPDCDRTAKRKTSIHIIEDGLYGGCNEGRPGIWVGPGALADHWGLGHEWMHSMQCMTPGFADCGSGGCWIFESHANFMPHQLPEYRDEVHCSEMLVNAPHLYYGSTRDRYCNWQFFEFLKDKHCYKAVNEMWSAEAPSGQRDPWNKLARNMGWNTEQLNDFFGEWAMHNVTWDYRNPAPVAESEREQGHVYRQNYGPITGTDTNTTTSQRLRLTKLEPLDAGYAENRRFVSPTYFAPQRWGYNVVRLYPEAGATSVKVTFRGVTQAGANSGWRFGLVATDQALTTPRYSTLMRGTDADLEFCVTEGESLWLVVMATPTEIQKVVWDQAYPSIYRYPYMLELAGAWPDGFRNGAPDACPNGTERHENGGGCAPASLASSVYVGPYAQVLGGTVSGDARIEDHATILNGASVTGGKVGALSILQRFSVSGSAVVETTFYPPGFFETGQGLSGTARLFGDVEYRGAGLNRSSGSFFGFVDNATASAAITDITVAPPYTWRP